MTPGSNNFTNKFSSSQPYENWFTGMLNTKQNLNLLYIKRVQLNYHIFGKCLSTHDLIFQAYLDNGDLLTRK